MLENSERDKRYIIARLALGLPWQIARGWERLRQVATDCDRLRWHEMIHMTTLCVEDRASMTMCRGQALSANIHYTPALCLALGSGHVGWKKCSGLRRLPYHPFHTIYT